MDIETAVQHMSKRRLKRILDNIDHNHGASNLKDMRQVVIEEADQLSDPDRVLERLDDVEAYEQHVLHTQVLKTIFSEPSWTLPEDKIIEGVITREQEIIEVADDDDALRYADDESVNILKAVLRVAIGDDRINPDEVALIDQLRKDLELSEKEQNLILAQLRHFPRPENALHSRDDIKEALKDLQWRGVLFQCTEDLPEHDSTYVIPEEVGPAVKEALGLDLNKDQWGMLLKELTKAQMQRILGTHGIKKSGNRDEVAQRILEAHLRPLECLEVLKTGELYNLCSELDLKVAGPNQDRISRIIEYFGNIEPTKTDPDATEDEVYYESLEALAACDYPTLRHNEVIEKEGETASAFEEGTRYLFREKLRLDLVDMGGTEHPDGCVESSAGLLYWDNKSKEDSFILTRAELEQFLRYIEKADARNERVLWFLVVVPEAKEGVQDSAQELKMKSPHQTEVAVLTATNLKWLAEHWTEYVDDDSLPLQVFSKTGVLTQGDLERHLKALG